ncbi:leukotoxin LktA family filamentous adhesin [Pseudaquabacterium pictum]|uniref:leukotoxin LktA family filamentous adhesin n=1 Tax=Pseudaquabacterium pictum TaxID=2315236 RepID=UPI001396CD5F|nr:leukotoxin LktA family filamentous adhesin [Rubrivivax pictus]
MTAAACGYLNRQYRAVLLRCARANAAGLLLLVGLPPAMAQVLGVVPDGRTATTVQTSGNLATVQTGTVRGANAFNSFSRFDVGSGQQVNLLLPGGSSHLINLVGGARSQIDGWVNAYKDGRIGGHVFFFNSNGFVVGAGGVLNAGSLTLAAPSASFLGQLMDGSGRIDAAATLAATSGSYPLSASGLVRVDGRLNATDGLALRAASVATGTTATLAAGPEGAAAFAALVNVAGLDSAAGVSTAGGRIRITGSQDVALAGRLAAAASPDGSASLEIESTGGSVDFAAGTRITTQGAPAQVTAADAITLQDTLLSTRRIAPPAAGTPLAAAHDSAESTGLSGSLTLTAPRITLQAGSALLAHGGGATGGGQITLTASDDAARPVFGSSEDQTAAITLQASTVKGAGVALKASASDRYVFTDAQEATDPTLFEELGGSLVDFVTGLRLVADVTLSKAQARITLDGGSLLQATQGDATLQAEATAYAGMNVRSTILGFGYGQATADAQVQVGRATVLAARDLTLRATADNTVSVEVGTTNIGSTSNNASNPTGYANAAVAVGVASTTARVASGSQAVLGAGQVLTLETGGEKRFGVAASGGSFGDGMVSAGIAVGLSQTTYEATLGGMASANRIHVASTLADASSEVQAAAGSGGKAQSVHEAVSSARTLDGSVLEALTSWMGSKLPQTDSRSGNQQKLGLSASLSYAEIGNSVSAGIAAGARVTSQGATSVLASATDTPVFRASAAVDERDLGNEPGAGEPAKKDLALSGSLNLVFFDHATSATIGDGAVVQSAGALDVRATSRLVPGWNGYQQFFTGLYNLNWTGADAAADLGETVSEFLKDTFSGNTWVQNAVESERLSLSGAATWFDLDHRATARIGAAQINPGNGAANAAQDVRVAASATHGMLHLAGVPEIDGSLLSSNTGSGQVGVGLSYLQVMQSGGAQAVVAPGASLRADDLAVAARTAFDQVTITENAGKAGKVSVNGAFSIHMGETATEARLSAGSTVDAGQVLVLADDDSLLVNIAGGVARAGSVGIGASAAVNQASRETRAIAGNGAGLVGAAAPGGGQLSSRGNLAVQARNGGTQGAFAVAGSGPDSGKTSDGPGGDGSKKAGSDSGSQGSSGIGISAAVAVNTITDTTEARVSDFSQVQAQGSLPGVLRYDLASDGETWRAAVLLPGVGLTASNPTLTLAGAGALSIAVNKTAGLAGAFTWNQLAKDTQAVLARSQVQAGAGISAQALNSNAMWSIAAGANAGGKLGVAGTVSYSTVENTTRASAVDAQLGSDGTVRLLADDSSSVRSIAGAASFSGKAGFGAALGLTELANTTEATLLRSSVNAQALDLQAEGGNDITAAAAALAVSSGLSGSGAVSINTIDNDTAARVQQSTVTTTGAASAQARDDSDILSIAGSGAISGGSAGIGISAAYNDIGSRTRAEADRSSLGTGSLALQARQLSTIDVVAAGAAGASGAGITGSLGINRIGTDTSATATGSSITAGGTATVSALDAAGIFSVTGAASAAGNAAIGAAASYNEADNASRASVSGGSISAADIAVTALRSSDLEVWSIAGSIGGSIGLAGSIGINFAGGATSATVDGGARLQARNNALLLADADDSIRARAGSVALGGSIGGSGAIALNDITATTAATLRGTGTLLEGQALDSASTLRLPSGTLSPRSSATQLPSDNPLADRQQTETLRGAAVLAASTAGVENIAISASAGGTAGVAGTVTVAMLGGSTSATVDGGAALNRRHTGDGAQRGLVAAQHHGQVFSGTGAGAVGVTAGVGGAADTAIVRHATTTTVDNAALAARDALTVRALSTREIGQAVVGVGGGIVGLAGSLGLVLGEGSTQALVRNAQLDAGSDGIGVRADSRTDLDTAAGALSVGAAGFGITATVGLNGQTTRADVADSRLDASGSTTVRADSGTTLDVHGATAALAGGVGVAGTVDVQLLQGQTEARIGGSSRINTQTSGASTQDVTVAATDTANLTTKVGGLGVGVGVGASAAVDVLMLRSASRAAIDGSSAVRAQRDIVVDADTMRTIDSLAIAGGAGLTSGIAGAVSVAIAGAPPDADSSSNASRSVAKAVEMNRGGSTGSAIGHSGGSRASGAVARADAARAGVSPQAGFDASAASLATAPRSAEASVASGASLLAGNAVRVQGHTRNTIDNQAVGVAVSAGFSLGGGFAVAITEDRTRAALAGRTQAATVTVQALDDQPLLPAVAGADPRRQAGVQEAQAGGGGLAGLAASLAFSRQAGTAEAELAGTVQASGTVVVEAEVAHAQRAEGVGAGIGVVGVGASVGTARDDSRASARLASGTQVDAGGLRLTADARSDSTADVLAAAGGLFGAGTGAGADAATQMVAEAVVGHDVRLGLGSGQALVQARTTPRALADAEGWAVSAGVSMGASIANVDVASQARVQVGDRLRANAGSLTLRAETAQPTIGTLPPAGTPVRLASGEAEASAASGGLLLGASATSASTRVAPSTLVQMGSGHDLRIGQGFTAESVGAADGRSTVTGINAGIAAAGANLAATTLAADTRTLLGAGSIQADTVAVRSGGQARLASDSTAGAGGLGAIQAAKVSNTASATTRTAVGGTLTARVVDIDASHATTLQGSADSTTAAVAGFSGAQVRNSIVQDTQAQLAPGALVQANAFTLDALSPATKTIVDDWAVRAAGGGVLSGSAGSTRTTLENSTRAEVGDGARITTADRGTAPAVLAIGARNQLDLADSVLLDTGGAIAVAATDSVIDARRNDAQVRIGSGALLRSSRDVLLQATTSGVVDVEAQSKTYGLAGAAEGSSSARIATANGITLDGGRIESDANVRLEAGAGNVLRADAETRLWNRTAVPMPGIPDADALLEQDNRIIIRPYALPAGTAVPTDLREAQIQRAAIATVGDTTLAAGTGQTTLRGFGRGTDLYREALQAIGQLFDGDLSLDTQGGRQVDLSRSSVQVDGTVFAGTRWRQALEIGADGRVLRQTDALRFSTRDDVPLGREIETRIKELQRLVQAYADNPAVAAGFQADIAVLESRRQSLGVDAKVGFIDLAPATARGGNLRISGGALVGSGELLAPADASITVRNESTRFLRVAPGSAAADCSAALCIPSEGFGEILFNGARVGSNADITLRNAPLAAPGATAAFADLAERSTTPPPLIELRNTATTGAPDGKGGTGPRPEVQVDGNLLNPRGTVRVASTGTVTVAGDVTASTVDIATQGDFIKTFSLGYTHSAGDPSLVVDPVADAREATAAAANPTAKDPFSALLFPVVTSSGTVNTVARPGGAVIAGNNVFISGEKLNLNGLIQSGIADVQVRIDDKALDAAKAARGAWVALDNTATTGLDAALRPRLRWDAASGQLELGDIRVEGGKLQLFGNIFSTGGGQLKVLDGHGRIVVSNETAAPLKLNQLDTGSGSAGQIRITDTSSTDAQGRFLVTTLRRINGQVVSTQENANPKDDDRATAGAVAGDATGRLATYTPRLGRRLNWINAENTTVSYSQLYTRTCFGSCSWGELGDWLAKNAPTQTVVVSPPAVYSPRISGFWLSERDRRSADYAFSFRKERDGMGNTNEYFVERYRSGVGGANENIVTRRDWTWKERNFYTHSLHASRPVAIQFTGADSGTLTVNSSRSTLTLGDTLRNAVGSSRIEAKGLAAAPGASGAQIVADRLDLRIGDGGVGSLASPLALQMRDNGRLDLRSTGSAVLRNWQGGLRLGDVNAEGTVQLHTEGDITRADGSTGNLSARALVLRSDNGAIGSAAAPLSIDLPTSAGSLGATAAGTIAITERTGDLRLGRVASSGGDVWLRAPTGSIVDVDQAQSVRPETREALLGVAQRAGLFGSAADASVQATVQQYSQAKRQQYLDYWNLRGIREQFDAKGVSKGYTAAAYDSRWAYKLDAATAAQLKAANGWGDAELAAFAAERTRFYHQAAAEFGNGPASSFNPGFTVQVAPDSALAQALSRGGRWREDEVTQRISAGLFKDTADTQVTQEAANVRGQRITLEARDGIGRASTLLRISANPRDWEALDADTQLALLAAERGDIRRVGAQVEITPKDDIDLAMAAGGAVSASASGAIHLGAEGDLRLGRVASSGGEVRIKARGALLQETAGSAAVVGGHLLVEAGAGALGQTGNPLVVAPRTGGLLVARAADSLLLAAEQALVIDQVYTPADATLATTGSILARPQAPTETVADTNIRAGSLTLAVGGRIGDATSPRDALAVRVDGPLRLSADTGAWLAASGARLDLASAVVASGPLRLDADVGTLLLSGSLQAAGSIGLASTGALQQASGSQLRAAAVGLSAGGNIDLAGRSSVTGDLQVQTTGALRHSGQTGAGGAVQLSATGPLQLGGRLQAGSLAADSDAAISLDGVLTSVGSARFDAGTDWLQRGLLQTGRLDVLAGRDLTLTGIVRATDDVLLQAGRDIRLQGLLSTAGGLTANALRDLWVLGSAPVAAEGATYTAGRRRVLPAGLR